MWSNVWSEDREMNGVSFRYISDELKKTDILEVYHLKKIDICTASFWMSKHDAMIFYEELECLMKLIIWTDYAS